MKLTQHDRGKVPFLLRLGEAYHEIKNDPELPRRGGINAIRPYLPKGCAPPFLNRCAMMWDGHRTGDLGRGERFVGRQKIALRNTLEPYRSAEIVERYRRGDLAPRKPDARGFDKVPIDTLPVDSNGDVTVAEFGSCLFGDNVERLRAIADGIIDHIILDPTYGVPGFSRGKTEYRWDRPMDWEELWPELWRVLRSNGNIVICCAEPLSSVLRTKQMNEYLFDWKWVRRHTNVFASDQCRPLNILEDVLVFSRANTSDRVWNPQMEKLDKKIERLNVHSGIALLGERLRDMSGFAERVQYGEQYPRNILLPERHKYDKPSAQHGQKPQNGRKPINLMSYLIRTHSKPSDLILDVCFGYNSTGIAALLEGRRYLGIEKDRTNFENGVRRLLGVVDNERKSH